jgi:DNA invertase Pin-like site-specific DNA recombinase
MSKAIRVAIYSRVSTDRQTTENQLRDLKAVIERHGWQLVGVFEDAGVSGAKSRDYRLAFDRLLSGIARKDFDVVAAWSVDRLGRSLQDLVTFLLELRGKGVDLYLHQQGLDTATPAGRAMFQMLGVFAEFERAIIQERIKTGLARARATGVKLGRPKTPKAKADEVKDMRAAGKSYRQIARDTGLSLGLVHKLAA